MKVKFNRPPTLPASWRWLRDRETYCVLAIERTGRERRPAYRIESDDSATPALFDPAWFEIVDATIPPTWRVDVAGDVVLLGPAAWRAPGFWERFFDGDHEALETYKAETEWTRE